MDSKQFAWMYLVEHGLAGAKNSYYGGWDIVCERIKAEFPNTYTSWDFTQTGVARAFYLKEIKTIGVDWDKTEAPISDRVSEFNGTFNDPDYREILTGTLVLKDGKKQIWVSDAIKVDNVFDMMAAVSQAPKKFKNIFGK